MENWKGFPCESFKLGKNEAVIVFPKTDRPVNKLVLKTEYWGAYPDVEIKLLEKGYHLGYIRHNTRLATKADCDIMADFVRFAAQKYGLDQKCIPVGMSCGGASAMRFAGFYPSLTACIFLDAPVLNFASWPGKPDGGECEAVFEKEFTIAYPGIKRWQLVNFSEHPLNAVDTVIKNNIPIIMVYGTEDRTVIYNENGRLLEQALEGTDLLKTVKVEFRGHHPHGKIGDNSEIVDFIIQNSQE